MAELFTIFFVLGVLLAIVTLVGHGIWVLLELIFGMRSAAKRRREPAQLGDAFGLRACPRCLTSLAAGGEKCAVCGWPSGAGSHVDTAAGLAAVREQLNRYAWLGVLDEAARSKLASVIYEQEQALLERSATVQRLAAEAEATPATSLEMPAAFEAAGESAATTAPTQAAAPSPVEPAPSPVRSTASLPERARKYAASRAEAGQDAAQVETAKDVQPAEPAVPVSRLLSAFMEEKNIRWGELVGGLLIVGCSIALVISFWSEIAARPLVKFVLFNGVTAALFGVGLYTDRWWKIHTTSHGVLIIATLLVPLNFLAIAAFTQDSPPTAFLSLAGEAVSLVVFALLVYLAGRILVPGEASMLVVGVMAPSLMQLVVRRFAEPSMPAAGLYALAGVPAATYLATSVATARRNSALLQGSQASRLLVFLGLVSAAALLPLALIVYRLRPLQAALHDLSPIVALCGLPALLVGLVFWRSGRVGNGQHHEASDELAVSQTSQTADDPLAAGLHTAGIAVGVLGALIMVVAIILAWPEPALLLPAAAMTAAAMIGVAIWFGIPAALVPAGLAISGAWVVAFYLARGDLTWTLTDSAVMRQALLSAMSGHVLVPLAAIFGAVAWWATRSRRREEGNAIGLVAALTAVVSVGLVAWFGFARVGDPANATWTLGIYTLAALAGAMLLNRDDLARIGSALLLATLVQAIVYRYSIHWGRESRWTMWISAILSHASLAAIIGGVSRGWPRHAPDRAGRWLVWTAQLTSAVAALWIGVTAYETSAGALSLQLLWLAGVWVLLAFLSASALLFTLSQAALVLSIVSGMTAQVASRPWYAAARYPWLDPWFLEAQGIALAGYCLVMHALRTLAVRAARPRSETLFERPWTHSIDQLRRLLARPWMAMDRVVEIALVALVGCIVVYAALPGVAQELTPRTGTRDVPPIEAFEIAGIAHAHAADRGAWALLGAVIAALAAGLYASRATWRVLCLVLVAAAICPLMAAWWESEMAVASALRWLSAGFFAAASIGIWMTTGGKSSQLNVNQSPTHQADTTRAEIWRPVRDLLVALVVVVYVVIGAYVAQTAIMRAGMPNDVAELWPYVLMWALVLGAAALALVRLPPRFKTSFPSGEGLEREAFRFGSASSDAASSFRDVLLVLAIAPLAILLTFAVARGLDQFPITGPLPSSWFGRIGFATSYGVPLALVAVVFVGYAVRDRSSPFAFAAGLLFNVVATIVVLLRFARGGGTLDAVAWITAAQANAIVAGLVALVWMAVVGWHLRRTSGPSPGPSLKGRGRQEWPVLLLTQVVLAAALCAMFLLPALAQLIVNLDAFTWAAAADGVVGWLAVLLATSAAIWISWRRSLSQNRLALPVAALVALCALTAAHWDAGDWLAYHTLLSGACLAAWLLPVAPVLLDRLLSQGGTTTEPIAWSAPPARLFGLAAVLLAAWGYMGDPASPWWTLAVLVAIGCRAIWIAWQEGRVGFMWISGALFLAATSIFWLDWASQYSPTRGLGQGAEFLWINVLTAAAIAIVSVFVSRRTEVLRQSADDSTPLYSAPVPVATQLMSGVAFHRFAAWAIVATLLLTTSAGLIADLSNDSFQVSMPLAWAAWLAALAAALACWWDPAVRWPVACLYCVGLIGVGIYLDGLNFTTPMFHWALALALSAYSLATSLVWSARDKLWSVAKRWGLPPASTSGHGWLVSANILLGVAVAFLVFRVVLTIPEFTRRMVAAYAMGAQAFAIGLLARGAIRTHLQYGALIWGALFAIYCAWATLPPDFQAPWLHRLVLMVVALVVAVVVYGFGLVKFLRRENEWTRAAERLVPSLAALAAALIMVVMAVEVATYVQSPTGKVPIVMPALVAVGLSLLGLVIAAMIAALAPGRDPLGLSERGRTVYVYVAEGLAALLFLHIRVTMPWLFHGWFTQFWPLVVMAIAFVGVGFGELFTRRQQRVLAEPLANTGVLLPLLPVIGFWLVPSRVNYSLLLLSIGVLYAAMSALRKSMLYAALAAVAANASLWYWLYTRENFGFFEHPQLWLIPPALCALAAGFLNRERLTAEQSAALRYAAAIVIYASSTADIFINGVANAPWLPAVLAALSILGVLAGIMLRVRAFLYLGTTFLVVAIMTVIWHAAIHERHTWILWVAGIITGALIIALFGLFEKRRDDVLRVMQQLKQWEA